MKFLVLAAAVSLAVGLLAACGGGQAPTPQPTAVLSTPTPPTTVLTPTPPPSGTVVEVSLQDPGGSGSYAFSPSEFNFSVGDTVTFVLTSEEEFHSFTVDDLNIDVDVDLGATENLTFTFDRPGEFDLVCVPHEFLNMLGTITVQ